MTPKQAATPCTSCGACCSAVTLVVDVTPGEAARLNQKRRVTLPLIDRLSPIERLTEAMTGCYTSMFGGLTTQVMKSNKVTGRCVALRGRVGQAVSCAVYALRPESCRSFQPGNSECNRLRQQRGLEPIVVARDKRLCPWCQRAVAITATGANAAHPGPRGGKRCKGSGMAPIPKSRRA